MHYKNAVKHLTIREIPADLARALAAARRESGRSLNQTVKDLLARALDLRSEQSATNGLQRLAGTWSDHDLAEFECTTHEFERIDEELWR